MAGYGTISSTSRRAYIDGATKKKKKPQLIASGPAEEDKKAEANLPPAPDPNPTRKNQVKQMTGDFYSKGIPQSKSSDTAVKGPRGSILTGTTDRKLGGQFRGMVTAKQQNYQKGNRVYHIWTDAQGRHVRSFLRKKKPRTLK